MGALGWRINGLQTSAAILHPPLRAGDKFFVVKVRELDSGLQFLAGTALLSLGKSYALLPALREVRRSFFYGYVRHPVYAMYMLADLIVVLLQPSPWNAGVAAVGASAFFLRATLEEKVLCHDPQYAEYMESVRWRFFPGIH